MVLNVSLSPKWETVIFNWTSSPLKCALGRLEAKAVGQGCACSKNVIKMTSSSVTAYVSVILFLLFENLAYFFALRLNVCHKTKCGIDEDIPKHQLAFNYFADKNSTVNKKESKMKKANRNNDTTYLPWRKLTPVYPCCASLLCLTRRYFWPSDICDKRKWSHQIHWIELKGRPMTAKSLFFQVFFQMNKFIILHWRSFICFCFR